MDGNLMNSLLNRKQTRAEKVGKPCFELLQKKNKAVTQMKAII